jgi:hypothetical protein
MHRTSRGADAWDDDSDDDGMGSDDDSWVDEVSDDDDFGDRDFGDEDEPTIACPCCGESIHEDAPRCPHCGTYVSEEDAPAMRKPWWIVVGVGLCLYVVYRWTVG